MVFNTVVFLIFAAIFFAAWPTLRGSIVSRCGFIVVASFIFYGWWDARFLLLIIASGLIDYSAGLAMVRFPNQKKFWLTISLIGNVGSLAVFKYLNFFIDNVNSAAGYFDIAAPLPVASLVLPVGISFYTFQSMSYSIDVYRGELKPTRNVLQFFAYLSMFPQLVAGPIVRAADLLPALAESPKTTSLDRWIGLRWIVHGFFKKMVVADTLAPAVNAAFASETPLQSTVYWWIIIAMFALQIYCDFSGYSDIARGLGRWMGYDFGENFNHPYTACGFKDFWSRWHISLSTWFRDYVYVPLGGSKSGVAGSHGNMWITMLISGFWHGANWTFVIWGAAHALLLSLERITKWPTKLGSFPWVGRFLVAVITFVLACLTWVFFRADSFGQATSIIMQMLDFSRITDLSQLGRFSALQLLILPLMFLRELYFFLKLDQATWTTSHLFENARAVGMGMIIVLTLLFRGPGQTFVYFQF
jgi:alginate O-acetyltransferase complex protein AlgI